MKRLTIRNSDGSVSQPVDMKWSEALERLAAYEDMELEPEQLRVWIPTAEQLLNVGELVLIVRHSNTGESVRVEPAVLRPNGTWKAIGHKFQQTNVSHWMPMPVPPQEGEIC